MTESDRSGTTRRKFSMTRLVVTIIIVVLIAFVAFNIGTQVQKSCVRQVLQIE